MVQSRNQPNKHGGKKGEGGEWGRKKVQKRSSIQHRGVHKIGGYICQLCTKILSGFFPNLG